MTCVIVVSCLPWLEAAPASLRVKPAFTPAARLDAIRRAMVWTHTNIPAMDVMAGPPGPLAFTPEETVTCDFVARPRGIGSTLKFGCLLGSGRELKVRYGDRNGEVYGQVAATRLLWALGFGANRMYPVKIVCRGCTSNPWDQTEAESSTTSFDPATVDVKMDGTTLEVTSDEGWSWKELDLVDETAGGAPEAQRDALKLLAVLIQHGSNKRPNQRILCLETSGSDEARSGGPGCAHPLMMVTDVGKTFGRANALDKASLSSVNFKEWSRLSVWTDSTSGCVGNLARSRRHGTLDHPRIGEPGRAFLADLLGQLTDAQLRDTFEVARFARRNSDATVDDWVNAFKQKRAEIVRRRCAEAPPPQPDRDAAAMDRFERAVQAYTALHQRVARTVPAVEISADAGSIRHAVDTLAAAIRAARPTAAAGNIFAPDIAAAFTTRIRQSLARSGYTTAALLAEINEGSEVSSATAVVNGPFPWARGSMMPPSLLPVVPRLPPPLQYRFVDRDLVLVDVDAGLVVDILPAVLTTDRWY